MHGHSKGSASVIDPQVEWVFQRCSFERDPKTTYLGCVYCIVECAECFTVYYCVCMID